MLSYVVILDVLYSNSIDSRALFQIYYLIGGKLSSGIQDGLVGLGSFNKSLCPIFLVFVEYLSQSVFQCTISHLQFTICLRVIWGGILLEIN